MEVTVIIPAHNSHAGRLRRALHALQTQASPGVAYEILLVDNASSPPIATETLGPDAPPDLRIVREPALGLTAARRRGLFEARGEFIVFVDDDNVLAPDYLANVVRLFGKHPRLGALGGKCIPEFESEPAPWTREFLPMLALRDLGNAAIIATTLQPEGATRKQYPAAAPIGAGLALRRSAAQLWFGAPRATQLSDRRGTELSSGGDNDIVLTLLEHDWHVGYFPELVLTHLIPTARLAPEYLARLNCGIQSSWMQVLTQHAANPWPPISPWSAPLRKIKAWFTHRAWSGPPAHIRWQGACGHFEGRVLKRSLR